MPLKESNKISQIKLINTETGEVFDWSDMPAEIEFPEPEQGICTVEEPRFFNFNKSMTFTATLKPMEIVESTAVEIPTDVEIQPERND